MTGFPFFQRHRDESVLVVLLFTFLVMMTSQVTTEGGESLTRHMVQQALSPLLRSIEGVSGGVRGIFYAYADFRGVVEENRELKERIVRLETRALRHAAVENQFRVLREMAGYRAELPVQTLPAHVISHDVRDPFRMLSVNRGRSTGVLPGMAVLSPEGVVGRVVVSTLDTAQIQLVTDSQSALAVHVLPGRFNALARGRRERGIVLTHLPPEGVVNPGDLVLTSGYEAIYPEGYPLGIVREIEVEEGKELERRVWVEPSAWVRGLTDVLVVVDDTGRPGR